MAKRKAPTSAEAGNASSHNPQTFSAAWRQAANRSLREKLRPVEATCMMLFKLVHFGAMVGYICPLSWAGWQ